jgi:hypothetical protein
MDTSVNTGTGHRPPIVPCTYTCPISLEWGSLRRESSRLASPKKVLEFSITDLRIRYADALVEPPQRSSVGVSQVS